MKLLLALALGLTLTSCNTLIGIGRDTKEGFIWTKNKIQEKTSGGGSSDYDAPVY